MARIDDLRIEPTAYPSRRRRAAPLALGALGLAAGALLFAFLRAPASESAGMDQRPGAGGLADPTTTAPAPPPRGTLNAGGYLEVIPPGPQAVSALVEARVESIEAIEGQSVEAGEVLVVLDDTLHRQRLSDAAASHALAQARLQRMRAGARPEEVAEAEARLQQAEARHRAAKEDLKRAGQLTSIGAAPEKRLIEARAEADSAAAEAAAAKAQLELRRAGGRAEDIAIAEAEVAVAESALQRARWAVEACAVKAPADGVVLEIFARMGEWVSPTGEGGRSAALMTLFDPRRIQAWVEINQRDAGRVFVGQQVELAADSLPGDRIEGRVSRILPKANLQRNTIHVKIEIPSPAEGLRPEMGVQAAFQPAEPGPDDAAQAVRPATADGADERSEAR